MGESKDDSDSDSDSNQTTGWDQEEKMGGWLENYFYFHGMAWHGMAGMPGQGSWQRHCVCIAQRPR